MYCEKCNKAVRAIRTRKISALYIECPECHLQVKVFREKATSQARVLVKEPDGNIRPPRSRSYFIGEVLCEEAQMIAIYADGLRRGSGKTHMAIYLMEEIKKTGDFEIFTNIIFKHRKYPPGITYASHFGKMLFKLSKMKLMDPTKRFVLIIDEFPNFLNCYQAMANDASMLQKLLDITRKFPLVLIGIGPLFEKFAKQFRDMVEVHLVKDLAAADAYGKHVKEVTMLHGQSMYGNIERAWLIPECSFTRPGGEYQYDEHTAAIFELEDWLLKDFWGLQNCLSEEADVMPQHLHDWLQDMMSRKGGKEIAVDEKTIQKLMIRKLKMIGNQVQDGDKVVRARIKKDGRWTRGTSEILINDAFVATLLGLDRSTVGRNTENGAVGVATTNKNDTGNDTGNDEEES